MRVTRFAAAAIAAGAAATMLIPSAALADNAVSSPEPQTSIVPEETNTPAPEDTNTPAPDDTKAPPVDETETPAPGDSETPNPGDSETPGPVEPPKDFQFGEDKIELGWVDGEPPGIKLDVVCPTTVAASSNWFVSSPEFAKAGDMLWSGTGYLDEKKALKDPVFNLRVSCSGYGYVVFTFEEPVKPGPGKSKKPKIVPAKPKVPVGAPQTGDGTTLQKSGMPLAASGSAVALLAMAGITLAARRRVSGQESE